MFLVRVNCLKSETEKPRLILNAGRAKEEQTQISNNETPHSGNVRLREQAKQIFKLVGAPPTGSTAVLGEGSAPGAEAARSRVSEAPGPRALAGVRRGWPRGRKGTRRALPASLRRSGYASPRSFRASERPAAVGRSRESSFGAAAAAGNAGPRREASPPARAATAGPPGSPARGSRREPSRRASQLQTPGRRAHSPRSRARPAPPPGPQGPPPRQPLVQRRGLRAAPAPPRSPSPGAQGRGGPRPVGGTRAQEARAAGPRLTSSRSGQAAGPRMAPRPSSVPQPRRPGAHGTPGPSRPRRAEGVDAAPPAAPPAVTRSHPPHVAGAPPPAPRPPGSPHPPRALGVAPPTGQPRARRADPDVPEGQTGSAAPAHGRAGRFFALCSLLGFGPGSGASPFSRRRTQRSAQTR